MLYWLADLSSTLSIFNVFRYLTVRTAGSTLTALVFPVFKDMVINLGWFFPVFAAFVIVGAGNAVNLTDGLDGLAIGPVMIASASFVGISYLVGNAVFADYLQIHFVPGSGELA